MLFNSCCVNFYEEDFLLLFSSLWLLPGFPAATSAKQIRLHLKGNMLAYYTGVGEVGKSFEQQQHIDFLVMLSSFSSSALLILLFLLFLLQLYSNSKAVSQSTVQFGSLVFLSFLSFHSMALFSETKVEKPIRKLISRLTFLLSLPLMKRQRRHLPQNNDIFPFEKCD